MQQIGLIIMRRSKLEMHIAILEALAFHGKLRVTHLMYKANINCNVLKEYLDILIQHDLVEKQISKNKTVEYAITEAGLTALKNAMQINKAIPIIEADVPSVALFNRRIIES
jgi:predicted transcriptional regulator